MFTHKRLETYKIARHNIIELVKMVFLSSSLFCVYIFHLVIFYLYCLLSILYCGFLGIDALLSFVSSFYGSFSCLLSFTILIFLFVFHSFISLSCLYLSLAFVFILLSSLSSFIFRLLLVFPPGICFGTLPTVGRLNGERTWDLLPAINHGLEKENRPSVSSLSLAVDGLVFFLFTVFIFGLVFIF